MSNTDVLKKRRKTNSKRIQQLQADLNLLEGIAKQKAQNLITKAQTENLTAEDTVTVKDLLYIISQGRELGIYPTEPVKKIAGSSYASAQYRDYDYRQKLNPDEKAFLKKFDEEYYRNQFGKDPDTDLHSDRRKCFSNNNARSRDIYHNATRSLVTVEEVLDDRVADMTYVGLDEILHHCDIMGINLSELED